MFKGKWTELVVEVLLNESQKIKKQICFCESEKKFSCLLRFIFWLVFGEQLTFLVPILHVHWYLCNSQIWFYRQLASVAQHIILYLSYSSIGSIFQFLHNKVNLVSRGIKFFIKMFSQSERSPIVIKPSCGRMVF